MRLVQFLKTTVIGGLVFLLPFAFVFFAVSYVLRYLAPLFHRAADRLDVPFVGGATLVTIIASLAIILLCFLAGLVAQSPIGSRARNWIEANLLGRVAAYRLLQSIGEELGGQESSAMQVALVWTDGWQPAFIIERHSNGYVTVVIPDAPTATGGSFVFLPSERVHVVDVKISAVIANQRRMGLGSALLFDGMIPPPPAGA